ncbi:hypothetical protein [Algibacter marinivivus]|nr:hypothetical protein [Algibacter marinivivus]
MPNNNLNNQNSIVIDLSKYRGNNSSAFIGRLQGENVRKEVKLDNLDTQNQKINVFIPLGTTSFNPSFFLGLFYKSFKKLKGREGFNEIFTFTFDEKEIDIIKEIIKENISEALRYAQNALDDFNNGFRF